MRTPDRNVELTALLASALDRYRARCFWNCPAEPDASWAPTICQRLRKHGDMAAVELAERIEWTIAHATG